MLSLVPIAVAEVAIIVVAILSGSRRRVIMAVRRAETHDELGFQYELDEGSSCSCLGVVDECLGVPVDSASKIILVLRLLGLKDPYKEQAGKSTLERPAQPPG
jgi:hypothetical protein